MAGESEEGEGCFSGFFGIFAGPRGRLADAVVVERAKRDKSPAALFGQQLRLAHLSGCRMDVQDKAFDL